MHAANAHCTHAPTERERVQTGTLKKVDLMETDVPHIEVTTNLQITFILDMGNEHMYGNYGWCGNETAYAGVCLRTSLFLHLR